MIVQAEPINDMALLASLETADGMFAVDSEQRIVYWSDSAERILGHASAQVIGKKCFDVLGGRDSRNFPSLISACGHAPDRRHEFKMDTSYGWGDGQREPR